MGIVVNVSTKEATAGPQEPFASGKYHLVISDVEMRESKSNKNKGKPMYGMEFTVQESELLKTPAEVVGRKVYTNACLWDGALYTIIGLMKALEMEVNEGQLEIPEPEDFLGLEVIAKIVITPKKTATDENTGEKKEYEPRNDIKGFFSLNAPGTIPKAGSATSGGSSVLPS
jgi:hypothetical protein